MGLTDEELVDFPIALEELEQEGAIIRNRSDLYGVPSRMHLVVGRISMTAKGFGFIIPVLLIACIVIAVYECIRHMAFSRSVMDIICVCNLVITTLLLIFQRKLPYLRVFSYACAIVCFCFCICAENFINVMIRFYNRKLTKEGASEGYMQINETERAVRTDKWYSGYGVYIPVVLIVALFVIRYIDPSYKSQLAGRETEVYSTLYVADVTNRDNIAVLDCDQQYLLKFGWDIDCTKTDVEGADCVIIDKNMLTPGYAGEDFWKFYQTYETIDWEYMDTMRSIYENERFILYVK